MVVVKNGPREILYVSEGYMEHVLPASVSNILDTTSAVTVLVRVLGGSASMRSTADTIRFASKVARAVIGRKGALMPLPLDLISPEAALGVSEKHKYGGFVLRFCKRAGNGQDTPDKTDLEWFVICPLLGLVSA